MEDFHSSLEFNDMFPMESDFEEPYYFNQFYYNIPFHFTKFQCSAVFHSVPPENDRKPKVFRGYRIGILQNTEDSEIKGALLRNGYMGKNSPSNNGGFRGTVLLKF